MPEAPPLEILSVGRAIAASLANSLQNEPRLSFARTFCEILTKAFWDGIQSHEESVLSVPKPFGQFNDAVLGEDERFLAVAMGTAAARIDIGLASYLIGSTYTAILPEEKRSQLGAYYTPPGLVRRLLDMATDAGVDWNACRICDPACGGGAFLAPVASRMIAANRHLSAPDLVRMLAERIQGWEIDPFSAWLSQVFFEAVALDICREAGQRLPAVVEMTNSLLREDVTQDFDLIIGNPPYGRVILNPALRKRYSRSLYGHANLYGLFTDLALQMAGPGGVVAFVTPTSSCGRIFQVTPRTYYRGSCSD